jgi:hypothetical protein
MPNGVDKNFRRLLAVCALYRSRYNEWPAEVRMHPIMLHDLARLLDDEQFQRLAAHVRLGTRDTMGISAGGRGVVQYGERGAESDPGLIELAEQWLGIQPRHDD